MKLSHLPRGSRSLDRGSAALTRFRSFAGGPLTFLLLACLSFGGGTAGAISRSWVLDANGNWILADNWEGGSIPNGVGDIAVFRNNITANRIVTLNGPITLGGLVLGDTLGTQTFTFAGGNALTLDNGLLDAQISKFTGVTDVWQAPLVFNSNAVFNIHAGTLQINGSGNAQVPISGSGSLVKGGAGVLQVNGNLSSFGGSIVLDLGTLVLGGANSATPSLGSGGPVVINGSGSLGRTTLQLRNNGAGSNGTITYDRGVDIRGAAQIYVDSNFIGGANSGNTVVLPSLFMSGGFLQTTGANGYSLRVSGPTMLLGQTTAFFPNSAQLTLAGPILDFGLGSNLVKDDTGRLVVSSAANSFGGSTAVRNGILQLGPGAGLGAGSTFVNGGALTPANKATLDGVSANGLVLVGQLGTSRFVLPAIGLPQSYGSIAAGNNVAVDVPVAGLALAIDTIGGTVTNDIDLSLVGNAGGGNRVWLTNLLGADRTFQGVVTPSADGNIRLASGGSTLIVSGDANRLGGAASTAGLIFGYDHANPMIFSGTAITQATGGTVSVRTDNDISGPVTINRGVTANVNGAITSPLGSGAVTLLGGTLSTDNASAARLANTDFRLFGGSTLLLDNAAVTTGNADRRLLPTSEVALTSSTLRFIGDGGAAVVSTQALASLGYAGGSTLSLDTDGATAGRLAQLTVGSLNRIGNGTLVIRNISNTATTLGTATATQSLLVTSAPTVTNGMIGANIVLWGGANANDAGTPLFATYDATHGVQAATFSHNNTLSGAGSGSIVNYDGTAFSGAGLGVQALRIRSTANTHTFNATGTMTIGAGAAPDQGGGLFLSHTANNGITHTSNFGFGAQEGLLYVATTGGTAGIITLSGVLSGSNGITRFGDGILSLTGQNTFTGPLSIQGGETRISQGAVGLPTAAAPSNVNLWGGSFYLQSGSARYQTNLVARDDVRIGNVNVGSSGFNDLVVEPRSGSSAPVVVRVQNQAGGNVTTAWGSLVLNGDTQMAVVHPLQVNGGIVGTGNLEKFYNERLILTGSSSGYSGNITSYAGGMTSLANSTVSLPFGTGSVTLQPGAGLSLGAPNHLANGQLTLRSDHGGISGLGMLFVADPLTALPSFTTSSSAPWAGALALGAVGFSQSIDQSALGAAWGGDVYLGGAQGFTGIFTGSLAPAGGSRYLLGTQQGTIRLASPLTGGNTLVVGVSMTGTGARPDQVLNNAGGVVQIDVAQSHTGGTVLNPNINLRISGRDALAGTGPITLAGGLLRVDSVTGATRLMESMTISNDIVMTNDSTIQMENTFYDARLGGTISLAPGSTGVVRTLSVGVDQPGGAANNAGMLWIDGGIGDGVGGSGNHFVKGGPGVMFFNGTNTYTGSTTIAGGFLGINTDADWGQTSLINLVNGGIAVWENSFTTARNYHIHGSNGYFDVAGGLTLSQSPDSVIDGGSSLIKRGLGTLVLNGQNAMVGVYSGDGILQFNNQLALGDAATTSAFSFGNDQTFGGATAATRYTGGTVRINFTGATNRGAVFNNNANTNFSGGIDITAGNTFTMNGAFSQGTELDFGFKTGAGTLVTTANNAMRGFAMTNGAWQFANSAPWANSTATAADNTFIEMLGGTMRALNTGANIALTNQASTTTYRYGGGMTLQMGSGTGFSVEFDTDNLLRENQGTLVIQTLGSTTLGGAGNTNAARFLATNAVNGSLARASALHNGIFGAHLLGADASGAGFFLANAATGFVPYDGPFNTGLAGFAPSAVADISSPQALVGTNSIYALRTSADISGGILRIGAIDNIRSGGLVINGSNTISSGLVFDPTAAAAHGAGLPGEALVFVQAGQGALLSGAVTANGFTKFGNGSLTLSGAVSAPGFVSVQSGTLSLGAANVFGRMSSDLRINAGATFDLGGFDASFETVESNNRTVANARVGGRIVNSSANAAALSISGSTNSVLNGTLDLNLRLVKAGGGVLTMNGFSASSPDSGANSFTGGTDIYGVGNTGGIILNNTTLALGGGGGSTPGAVNLFGGTLGLRFSNGTTGINSTNGQQFNNMVVVFGRDGTLGLELNVRGPALINVDQSIPSSNTAFGVGNIMQVGMLNMSNTTLQISGGNGYRFRVGGQTTIMGSQAAFQTNSDGPGGVIELFGPVVGGGTLTKLGDGALRTLVLGNANNSYSGGTNIIAGDVQVLPTSGTPLGTGPVRLFPDGTLRLAGNGSLDPAQLTTMSRINAMAAVMLGNNFAPTVLNGANFTSHYNTTLQLGENYFQTGLDLAAIGNGRAFLGTGLNTETRYMAATLGAGVPDAWNPGVGVYRLVGGVNNLAFDGADNVLTGNAYLQVGPQIQNALGTIVNGGNSVIIRNANDFTGGTQIARGSLLLVETGGRASGETPLGTGAVEVYGELRLRGAMGSMVNPTTGLHYNTINLRPGGVIRLHETDGLVATTFLGAGGQGRWADSIGIDLNGGEFRYDGAANLFTQETIGDVIGRKRGVLTVARNSGASAAQLNVGDISRAERGVVTISYNSGFLGINTTAPLSFERLTATSLGGVPVAGAIRAGTTLNGSGVVNGGMVAPWMIDRVTHTFLGYNPTAANTGFQPILSTTTPGVGQIAYNQILTGAAFTATGAGDIVDVTTAAKTLGANVTMHALRSSQNISPTAAFNTMTFNSGGLILTGGTINPTGAVTAGVVSPMTLNFGAGGGGEALIYNNATAIVQAQINAAQGLTKFGAGQLQIHSVNPGIGAPVVVHEGTLYVRVPIAGGGSGAPVGQALNGQDVILNGGALVLDSFLANADGTASEIASNIRSTGLFDGHIQVANNATLGNNGQGQYARVQDLTIANSAGSSAMDGNGNITLTLQSGIWVRGTTTLSPQAVINGTFNGFSQSTLAGLVTGAGGLVKTGNGATTLLNGGNNYAGGTTILGAPNVQSATSTVASAFRGAGTPFSTGDIRILPGGHLRLADNANIASNAVYLFSDAYSLGGIGLAHNQPVPTIIASGTPAAGQIRVDSSGPFAGVLTLDYGFYNRELDLAAIPGGDWWLGNSQQAEAYYFAPTLGAAAGGRYLIGGGGNQNGVNFGSILTNATRTTVFENLFTGGTAGEVRVEVGAQTGDFTGAAPAFINGNSGFMVMATRNTGLTGDVRVNTGSVLAIGNSFALGSGRLVVNGGGLRADFGNNNFAGGAVTLNNEVVFRGDLNVAGQTMAGDLVMRGPVSLSNVAGAGATRTLNVQGGTIAIRGDVSGPMGSSLIKIGAGNLMMTGANTYEGFTQIGAGFLFAGGDVRANQPGPLGQSDSAVILSGGSLRLLGRMTMDRDLIVATSGTLDTSTSNRVLMLGGINVASGQTLTVGAASAEVAAFRGGLLQLGGTISGPGALTVGTTAAVPAPSGTVFFSGNSNGYGVNTYAGGTTFQSARVRVGGSTYFAGPANNPSAILSGPFGTGPLTFAGGEANRGAIFEAVGGPVVIANALNAITVAANTTLSLGGHQSLEFTRDLNLNSDNTLRNRTFAVQNQHAPLVFSGSLSASGTAGVSLIKTGPGMLILNGANTFGTSTTTGLQINQGIVRINADAALGAGTHVRLNGGILSTSESITTGRTVVLQANNSGLDVAPGTTLTLNAPTAGAFSLVKTGGGILLLNGSNTMNALIVGGQAQLDPATGRYAGAGIVATSATTGTPFGTGAVTINGGALALAGAASAQSFTLPSITYGAAGAVALNQGAAGATLTLSTALTRGGAPAGAYTPALGFSPGTLYVVPTSLDNLGTTERLLVSAGAPANTATGGGNILATPSVFIRLQSPGDANFARYDAATGIREHSVATVSSLAASAASDVADISSPVTAGAGNIDLQALRTTADIAPTDGSTLLRLARGGLILNGASGATISAPLLFGTGPGAGLNEAIVYVREGQAAASSLTGGISARDFTKTGPGLLEIGGTGNLLNPNNNRLPVVSVQDGTLRFASAASAFQINNTVRNTAAGSLLGHFVLNVNENGVLDLNGLELTAAALTGNGTILSGVAGPSRLTLLNGFAVDTTWSGRISDGNGVVTLVKRGGGVLSLNGFSDHSGGTVVQSGRVANATGNAVPGGRLEPQTVNSLGTGEVVLEGGRLRLNGLAVLGGATNLGEVEDGLEFLRWGSAADGLNVTVSSTAVANGTLLLANTMSQIDAVTRNAGINRLTINAPQLNFVEGNTVVYGSTTINNNTTLRLAGGTVWMGGQINAAGRTITKTGGSTLVVYNPQDGAQQNAVGQWKISGGLVQARSSIGGSNPLGASQTILVNPGSTGYGIAFLSDGDGTNLGMRIMTYADTTVRFGSAEPVSSWNFEASAQGRIGADRAFLANSGWKTIQIAGLESRGALGAPYSYFLLGNNYSLWIDGPTTFERDFVTQIDGGQGVVFNGPISGNGTFVRRANGGTLFINADNSGGYSGGTFLVGGGRNYLGSIEGGQVSLSSTAKLGAGHVFLGALALFQINDVGNLQADQNIHVAGNLSWMANFSLAADLPLDQVRLRSLGLGGPQDGVDGYYRSAVNPSSAALTLGTVYTHSLDMMALGDGMWYLGSSTNGLGANGVFNGASLAPGLGATYRLGAGGNTLLLNSNGVANVLTDASPTVSSSLVVGAPMTVQSMAPPTWGTGTVVLLQDQNYTGSTLVNWNSTLDFRGTLATSGITVYGTLNVAGEGGTLINPLTSANIPVTLRPGSLLRLDNNSGVLPLGADEGRWADATPMNLNNSVLRLQGNAGVEVVETVGPITADRGGNRIEVVRGVIGRGTELRTPSIDRANFGTVQFIHNGSQLGADERVILTGGAPTVTNGMVAPWMVSASDQQFITYNGNTGFTIAGFDRVQGATTHTALLSASTARALFNGAQTLNGGDVRVYAARLDTDFNLTTAGAATNTLNRLIIDSGGLIANTGATRTIQTGLWAGPAGDQELIIWNGATLNLGLLANNTTSGRIRASSITKMGAGTFQILSEQPDFSGDIRVQQGALQLQYTATTVGNFTSNLAGNGGNIVLEGNNTSLILRIGNDSWTGGTIANFNKSIVLGDHVSVATINSDRAGGAITARRMAFNNLTFGQNEGDNGQVLRIFGANGFGVQINGTTTLVGRSAIAVDNAYNGTAADAWLMGRVTGSGMLIKGPSDSRTRNLFLHNETTLNDFTGGTVLQGGTLQVFGRTANVAANVATNLVSGGLGSGDITLMQGTLDLRVNNVASGAAADTNIEFLRFSASGVGPNMFVNGSSAIYVDRISGGDGANKHITFNNLTIGSQFLTMTGGNGYGIAYEGAVSLLGNTMFNFGGEVVFGGAGASSAPNSIGTGGGQVIINKYSTGTLWVHSTNNSLNAPIYINNGGIDFGNRAVANGNATLGTGTIFVNPNADLRIRSVNNINTALGQDVVMTGTAYSPASLRLLVGTALNQSQLQAIIRDRRAEVTSNENLLVVLEGGTLNQPLDQSTLGNGRVFFANVGDRTYNAASLIPGLPNLPHSVVGGTSANKVYRLGGRTQNTLIIDLAGTASLGDVDGPTDLQIGSQANLGAGGNWGLAQVLLQDQNTYSGQTIVARGSILRFNSVPNAANDAGPLGNPSAPGTTVYANGVLQVEGNGTFVRADGTANAYTDIRLRPGGSLVFANNGNSGVAANRWHDSAPVALDGARLLLTGANNIDNAGETVGALTFDRGARIALTSQGTGDALLTVASLTRAAAGPGAGTGRGTLAVVPSNTVQLGVAAAAGSAQQQLRFTNAPATSATATLGGVLPGYIVDATAHRFLRLGANGVIPVTDGEMVGMPAGPGTGGELVNLTAATTMTAFETTIFGLRGGNFAINSPTGANNDATLVLSGSGADIGSVISTATTFTINPNLRFGASGTNEAVFYAAGNIQLNGFLDAGTVTKFGTGTLVIANDQSDAARGLGRGYQGGWVINEGALWISQFGAAGNAHPGNFIVLNGNQASTPQLFLRAQPSDSLLNYDYSFGRLVAVDNANVDWDPGADNRVHRIGDIEIQQSGGIGNGPADSSLDAILRVANNRFRTILAAGELIITNNAILNVDNTATGSNFLAAGTSSAALTNAVSSGLSVAALTGSARFTKWGDGVLYIRGASPNFSGPFIIDQGTVHVTHNGSLGTGDVVVNRYGVLEIGVPDFNPSGSSLTYHEGSVERWGVDGARSGAVNLGRATLQIAANQPTTSATITLNGGGIEAFVRADDLTSASTSGGVLRVLNPSISFQLAGDSFVGARYYLGAAGLNMGLQPNDNRPMEEYLASGAILDIKGVIGGTGGLTKAGFDTVILSGANTYGGATFVEGGRLLIGIDNALPATTALSTTSNAVLDLNGQNQTVGSLSNPVVTTAATAFNLTSGFITNAATTLNTLTVGNGASADFTYSGIIQHNVSLTKVGTATFTLNNDNTYRGLTTVSGGVLEVRGRLSQTSGLVLNNGGRLLLNGFGNANHIVNAGADVRLDGGTLAIADGQANGRSYQFRDLEALGLSEIDFGAGEGHSLLFERIASLLGKLKIFGWSGSVYHPGATADTMAASQDRLVLAQAPSFGPTRAINSIVFYDNDGVSMGRGLQVDYGSATSVVASNMATAYWKGNLGNGAWNEGNWSSDLAGTDVPGLAPTGATDVILSASGQQGQGSMVLGEDMEIRSLAVNGTAGPAPIVLEATGGHTLTIVGASAINVAAGAPAATLKAPLHLTASTATVTVSSTSPLALEGSLSGTNLVKEGAGLLVLAAANQHTGTTTVKAGRISVSSDANLGPAPASPATRLILDGGGIQTTESFALDSNRGIQVTAAGGFIETAAGTALSAPSAIQLDGVLTKSGEGALLLDGSATGPGSVTVSAGTLAGSGSVAGGGSVGSGATISAGAIGSPGAPVVGDLGTLSFGGDLSFAAGSTWLVDLIQGATPNQNDLLAVGGNLGLGTGTALSVNWGGTFTQGTVFTLATFSTLTAGSQFVGFGEGDTIFGGGGEYLISYGETVPGAITLTAVPEPGTLGLLGLGLGGLLLRRLRRRAEGEGQRDEK